MLAHDRSGSGEPLILIHGFGSFRGVWKPVLPTLEAERDVIAIDLPGFGDSPPDVDHPTPARLAEAVAELADDLGLDRPHVAGFSMGGWIALELSKMGVVSSTCALCPAGFWSRWERAFCKNSIRASHANLRLLGDHAARLNESAPVRRAAYRQFMEHADQLTPEEATATGVALRDATGYASTLEALHEGHFTGGVDVQQPVTVAWGDKDKLLLPRQAERARRAIPQARHLRIPDAGHVPMVDAPETTARAILTSA